MALPKIAEHFAQIYQQLQEAGYFQEAFGIDCTDGYQPGKIANTSVDILLTIGKDDLWPVTSFFTSYSEDDLLDIIEYLYQNVSKPTHGTHHSWNNCGMHYDKFDLDLGRAEYREKINALLGHYVDKFELNEDGVVLRKVDEGFEPIFAATLPSPDTRVESRVKSAISQFRRHGSSRDDQRQAVRDLADVFELLRPQVKTFLAKKDEADLFNIANNFGIRHYNDKQQTNYDEALWLSWMFYFYLSTIHVMTRKIKQASNP